MNGDRLEDIPYRESWEVIKQINAGLSRCDKYYLRDYKGEEYLLRIADIREYPRKDRVFTHMKTLERLGLPMPKPIEMGICDDEAHMYMLLSFVPGEPLDKVIQRYSEEKQYEIGIKSGHLLKQIHDLKVSPRKKAQVRSRKPFFLKYMQIYEDSRYRTQGDRAAIAVVRDGINEIELNPVCYIHGDYKAANMIVGPDRILNLIDFDCCRIGDPYEDFFFTIYSDTKVSTVFARGKIDGYFEGEVPKAFWKSLRVYVAAKTIIFIPYNVRLYGRDSDAIYNDAKRIFKDYDYFNRLTPIWYK